MLSETKVMEIVHQFSHDIRKKQAVKATNTKVEVKPFPFTNIYIESVEMAQDISVHSDFNVFPEKLFRSKAPNENPDEFKYRKAIYQPITFPYWNKAVNQANRIWNKQNYAIVWDEEIDEDIVSFFETDFPKYKSFVSYYKDIFTRWKINDPNALITYRPKSLPEKTIETEEGQKEVFDSSKLIEPMPFIYGSEKVIGFEEGVFAFVLTDQKSLLNHGNRKVKEGLVLELYDDTNVYFVVQKGKKSDWEFDIMLYYKHDLGKLPAEKLKGIPKQRGESVLYQSYFYPAVPNLNIALCTHSTLDMSIYTHAFPQRWEYVDKCNAPGCIDGRIRDFDHPDKEKDCSKCNGTGTTNKHSPTSAFQVKTPTALDKSGAEIAMPPFGYVAPDSQILEFSYNKVRNDIAQAFVFINIDISSSNVKGSETALGKQIDREELFNFLLQFSSEVFDSVRFGINCMGRMRYGTSFDMPKIKEPVTFSIRNEADLTTEITVAKDANIPDIAIRNLLEEYLNSRFAKSDKTRNLIKLAFFTDRLITQNMTEIAQGIAVGTIKKYEAILHSSLITFIDEATNEDKGFMDKDIAAQKEILVQKAKDKEAELTEVVGLEGLPPEGGEGTEGGEGQAQGGQTAATLEAQAKLRGTVGGVQAIISVNAAVAEGSMTEVAAELLLEVAFGYPSDIAKNLIEPVINPEQIKAIIQKDIDGNE